jgi:hypothetical protein
VAVTYPGLLKNTLGVTNIVNFIKSRPLVSWIFSFFLPARNWVLNTLPSCFTRNYDGCHVERCVSEIRDEVQALLSLNEF